MEAVYEPNKNFTELKFYVYALACNIFIYFVIYVFSYVYI